MIPHSSPNSTFPFLCNHSLFSVSVFLPPNFRAHLSTRIFCFTNFCNVLPVVYFVPSGRQFLRFSGKVGTNSGLVFVWFGGGFRRCFAFFACYEMLIRSVFFFSFRFSCGNRRSPTLLRCLLTQALVEFIGIFGEYLKGSFNVCLLLFLIIKSKQVILKYNFSQIQLPTGPTGSLIVG